MNKKILVAVIPILFLIAGCQLNVAKQTVNQTPTQTFKAYESAKYGLSLQHPSSWNVYDNENGDTNLAGINISPESLEILKDKTDPVIAGILAVGLRDVQQSEEGIEREGFADQWIKRTKDLNSVANTEISEKKEITIDGKKVIEVDVKNVKIQSPSAPLDSKDYALENGSMYFLIHNGQRLMVSYHYSTDKEKDYASTLEKIVLSLKFNQEVSIPDADFSTPLSTITTLERELEKGNAWVYENYTYYSPEFIARIPTQFGMSYEDFRLCLFKTLIDNSGYLKISSENANAQFEGIEVLKEEKIDETHTHLFYRFLYHNNINEEYKDFIAQSNEDTDYFIKNKLQEYEIFLTESHEDDSYFIKTDDGWRLDIEPEMANVMKQYPGVEVCQDKFKRAIAIEKELGLNVLNSSGQQSASFYYNGYKVIMGFPDNNATDYFFVGETGNGYIESVYDFSIKNLMSIRNFGSTAILPELKNRLDFMTKVASILDEKAPKKYFNGGDFLGFDVDNTNSDILKVEAERWYLPNEEKCDDITICSSFHPVEVTINLADRTIAEKSLIPQKKQAEEERRALMNKDTDKDGLSDFVETYFYHTDPNKADTDGDGYLDGVEVKGGFNPNGAGKLFDQTVSSTTKNWKIYESTKYGLTFQYPPNWNVYDGNNGNTDIYGIAISPESEETLHKVPGSASVNIESFSTGKADQDEKNKEQILADTWRKLIKGYVYSTGAEASQEKEIIIDSKKVIEIDTKNAKLSESCNPPDSNNCVLENGASYFIFNNGKGFRAGYACSIEKEKDYASIMEQIMLSLKFK